MSDVILKTNVNDCYVSVDTELFCEDLLLMERCDVPRVRAEAWRESSSHDCVMTVF